MGPIGLCNYTTRRYEHDRPDEEIGGNCICLPLYGLLDRDVVLSALRLHLRPSGSLARRLPVLGAARDEAFRREVPAPRDQGPRAHGALGRLPSPLFAHGRVVVCALPIRMARTRIISFDKPEK